MRTTIVVSIKFLVLRIYYSDFAVKQREIPKMIGSVCREIL